MLYLFVYRQTTIHDLFSPLNLITIHSFISVPAHHFLNNYLKWYNLKKVQKCCLVLKLPFHAAFKVFQRLLNSVTCVNWFGWLCHFERAVRCLEPGNNARQSVCVVMLCYGFVLLCLSSQSFDEWTSLTALWEMLALSRRQVCTVSFLHQKLGHSMNSHLLLIQFHCVYSSHSHSLLQVLL